MDHMNWRIRKPIWSSLEEPKFDVALMDLGLGHHNGQPILISGHHDISNDIETTFLQLFKKDREQQN
jgi:hypothetical protein